MKKHHFILWLSVLMICLSINKSRSQTEIKITPRDAKANDWFGYSIAVRGEYAVIGAPGYVENGQRVGAVYLFRNNENSWVEDMKFTSNDSGDFYAFGQAVSINDNYIALGNITVEDNYNDRASVYIYKRVGDIWQPEAKLLIMDLGLMPLLEYSISVDNGYVAMGIPGIDDTTGAVYIFKHSANMWIADTVISLDDRVMGDMFGCAVAIDDHYLVVGAKGKNSTGFYSGIAYIFKHDGTKWIKQAELVPSDGIEGGYFGCSVSIDADYIIIGACKDGYSDRGAGAAYIFRKNGTNWSQVAKISASDSMPYDHFGTSVSINGDYAIVGTENGDAYLFKLLGINWIEQMKLVASDDFPGNGFGHSVSIAGEFVMVGAFGDDENGTASGAAYMFTPSKSPRIISIKDVPYDQGVWITITWQNPTFNNGIDPYLYYSIWRALPDQKLALTSTIPGTNNLPLKFIGSAYRIEQIDGKEYAWEWIANQPAHNFSLYSYTARTFYDSMATTDGKHYFLISAHTDNQDIFYDSNVDSGHSADNLAPTAPSGLTLVVNADTVKLFWGSSSEPDFSHYAIYRNGIIYDSTRQSYFIDVNVAIGIEYSYQLIAVDIHGNRSKFSEAVSIGILSVDQFVSDIPADYHLYQNYPNPFNSNTIIKFELPAAGEIGFLIYNLSGQKILKFTINQLTPGVYNLIWDGKDERGKLAPSGVYFYTIQINNFTQTKKMLFIR